MVRQTSPPDRLPAEKQSHIRLVRLHAGPRSTSCTQELLIWEWHRQCGRAAKPSPPESCARRDRRRVVQSEAADFCKARRPILGLRAVGKWPASREPEPARSQTTVAIVSLGIPEINFEQQTSAFRKAVDHAEGNRRKTQLNCSTNFIGARPSAGAVVFAHSILCPGFPASGWNRRSRPCYVQEDCRSRDRARPKPSGIQFPPARSSAVPAERYSGHRERRRWSQPPTHTCADRLRASSLRDRARWRRPQATVCSLRADAPRYGPQR